MKPIIRLFIALALTLSFAWGSSPKLIGYIPSYAISDETLPLTEHYTDVVFFGPEIAEDGKVRFTKNGKAKLEKLIKHLTDKKVRIHFCLGGWGKDKYFPTVCADPAKRKILVNELKALQKTYGFSGVDLDWEYPRKESEMKNFTLLIQEIQAALPKEIEVTAAFNPLHKPPKSLTKYLDRVHLMTYDLGNKHCDVAHAKKAITDWRKLGLTNDQLTIGAAFYSRHMNDRNKVLTYQKLHKTFGEKVANQMPVEGYYFDNKATLKQKIDLLKKENIAGMIVWQIAQDARAEHSLAKWMQLRKTE
eukprot:Seg11286.2 transcript_id=Seg11286.2/GoldUCD/mRNA.D3Y31 product="Chitinase 1" protein_id=Seg11286.2/GoldUCD/D3Y31